MALITYPLNDVTYSAEDAELYNSTRSSGVYAEDSFGYSMTGSDNIITIGTGIGWIKNGEFSGKVIANKNPENIDMGISDSLNPRIDAIVIRFDSSANETNIVVKHGTPSSSPVAPDVVRSESVYELHLYHVTRAAGALYVSSRDITDLRLNKTYCGLMADSVTHIDTSAIESQVLDLIQNLKEEIENAKSEYPYLLRTGGTMTGNIDMGGKRVTGSGNPIADNDLTTKKYVDTNRSIKLIWENENPTQKFSKQEIKIKLNRGDFIRCFCRLSTNYKTIVPMSDVIVDADFGSYAYGFSGGHPVRRTISATSEGIVVDSGYRYTSFGSSNSEVDNSVLIPVAIYVTSTSAEETYKAICGTFFCGEVVSGQ